MKTQNVICCFFTLLLFCSWNLPAKEISGSIILESGESINVLFVVPMKFNESEVAYIKMQYQIKYYDSGKAKKILRAGEVKEFNFWYMGTFVRMISVPNKIGADLTFFDNHKFAFIRLQEDGKLKLFSYYHIVHFGTRGFRHEIAYFIQKGDDRRDVSRLFFRSQVREMIRDCPVVWQKVEDFAYTIENQRQMVREYNELCASGSE